MGSVVSFTTKIPLLISPLNAAVLSLFIGVLCRWVAVKPPFPLPPGPKPRLLSGNLHQVPTKEPWLTYASWSKLFGPIIYYRIYGQKTIVLNTAKAATDLLNSRANIYSDRPTLWMVGELAGRKKTVFLSSFEDPRFKKFRRLLRGGLNPRAALSYRPIQMRETLVFLKALANDPSKFITHSRRNAAAVIMKVAYGYSMEPEDDKFSQIIEDGFAHLSGITIPGKYLVELLPFLRFIPEWFPGGRFKQSAREVGLILRRIDRVPFEWAKKNIETGNYIESFTSKHLHPETGLPDDEQQDIIKWCSAALYVGGADTTVSTLTTFFLLMALYPEVQRRAQAEVDHIASGRLPTLDDQMCMPYVNAMIKEIMRWGPVVPIGLPHRVMEDDIYDGYLIPKGTTILANIWAITHDEEMYPSPNTFDPERFIGEKQQTDPFNFVFGFGRRACPGAHFAEMSLFLNISNVLAVFNISKMIGENGQEIEPEISWSSGVTSHLKPFLCQIKPRSNDALQLLNN